MTIRVNPDLYLTTLNALADTRANEDTALAQVSSGLRVSKPSDDPSAAAANIGVQDSMLGLDQYQKSISSVSAQLKTADATMSSVITLITNAIAYGVQGGDATLSDQNRQVLATQIQAYQDQLMDLANTRYQGEYLFSGTSRTQPFVATPDADPTKASTVAYAGDSGVNTVEISSGQNVSTNVPGDQLFGTVFDAMKQLSDALHDGTDITPAMDALRDAFQGVNVQRVFYGNAVQQLDTTSTFLATDKVQLSDHQNELIGIDIEEAVTNLQKAATARQGALAAGSRIGQLSLLDYLK